MRKKSDTEANSLIKNISVSPEITLKDGLTPSTFEEDNYGSQSTRQLIIPGSEEKD